MTDEINGHVSFASPFECQMKQCSLNLRYPTCLLTSLALLPVSSLAPGKWDQAMNPKVHVVSADHRVTKSDFFCSG